jgi:hypothetical protein
MLPPGRPLAIWLANLSFLLVLFIGAQLNPAIYLLAGVLAPLPVLLAGGRLGERAAVLLALTGAMIVLAPKPGLETLWQNLGFLSLLLMGVLLCVLEHRGLSAPGAIFGTVLILNGLALLILVGQTFYQGISLQVLLDQKGAEIIASVHHLVGEGGAGSLFPGVPQQQAEALLLRLLPGLVVTNSALVAWLNMLLARQIAFWVSGQQPDPPLYHWALPEWLIFGVLGAGFMLLIPVAPLRYFSLNLLLVLGLLYFSQGVAVVATWLIRLRLPRVLRLIGYALMFLNPLFFLIIAALGVLDLWFDFRRLHQQPGDAGGGIES